MVNNFVMKFHCLPMQNESVIIKSYRKPQKWIKENFMMLWRMGMETEANGGEIWQSSAWEGSGPLKCHTSSERVFPDMVLSIHWIGLPLDLCPTLPRLVPFCHAMHWNGPMGDSVFNWSVYARNLPESCLKMTGFGEENTPDPEELSSSAFFAEIKGVSANP